MAVGTYHADATLMVWIPRPLGEGLCYHVRVQCNNRDFRFEEVGDFENYLSVLFSLKSKLKFNLHHFVIMSTHVHLMISTPGPILLNRIMQQLNHRTALLYHKRHHRSGHMWMHGYRCSVIDSDPYALVCMRYLDRNPLRAGITDDPATWRWSGHRFYASGEIQFPLDPHPSYLGLANNSQAQQFLYQKFVKELFPSDEVREKDWICRSLKCYGWRSA